MGPGELFKAIVPDVIKVIDDVIATARFGRGVMFRWPRGLGWSGADVEIVLRQHGIRAYARKYAATEGDEFGITVPTAQARWAERVLRGEGVPLTSPLYDESNRHIQAGQRIGRRWMDAPNGKMGEPVGLIGRLMDWLG